MKKRMKLEKLLFIISGNLSLKEFEDFCLRLCKEVAEELNHEH